jgi:hypothetical protein
MIKYYLTEFELSSASPETPPRAELSIEPRGGGRFTARWAAPREEPDAVEADFCVSVSRVARLAAAFPACLLAKIKADYSLADTELPRLLDLYTLQAAACALGLKLILTRQLVEGELAEKIAAAGGLEEVLPWVALLLQREGVPEMRWWEEQAENFLDLWYSPFRLHPWAAEDAEGAAAAEAEAARTERAGAQHQGSDPLAERVAALEHDVGVLMEWWNLSGGKVKGAAFFGSAQSSPPQNSQ